ncbi:MAG: response regulator [Thermodesulfobacteriota bacterium]
MTEKPQILIVDDEENILKSLQRMLRSEPYIIKTALTPSQAIEMCRHENFQVIIGDYRMPEINGTEMFDKINKILPDTVKIILSGYSDVSIVIEAINKDYINKYILKPWNDENLKKEIEKGIDQFFLFRKNKELHEKVIASNAELKKLNEDLEEIVRQRTNSLEIQNQALLTSQNVLNSIAIPVIGIDSDFMTVLTNEAAGKHLPFFIPGNNVTDKIIINAASETMKTNKQKKIEHPELSKNFPFIEISPLIGKKIVKGCVLIFIPEIYGKDHT